MAATQTFGDYEEMTSGRHEYLMLQFSPISVPLKERWRNNGLSADFMADYLTTFFPHASREEKAIAERAEVKSAVSFIANELIENAMKYSDTSKNLPIAISLHLNSDRLLFMSANSVTPQQQKRLLGFIRDITSTDPQELYLRRLEESAASEESSGSGLGLLAILNDYQAKIGWKFEELVAPLSAIVTTTVVCLPV